MEMKSIIAIIFGIFCVVLIASTGAFGEIISSFSSAMGLYGFILGVLIVIMIILAFLGIGGKIK